VVEVVVSNGYRVAILALSVHCLPHHQLDSALGDKAWLEELHQHLENAGAYVISSETKPSILSSLKREKPEPPPVNSSTSSQPPSGYSKPADENRRSSSEWHPPPSPS